MNTLIVSPSPHVHGKDNTRRLMGDVIIALLPAVLVSIWFFGLSAIHLVCVSVLACVVFEYLIQKFLLKGKSTVGDLSAVVTGVLLALNLPVCSPWWLIVIGALVAIGIAKMTFGGLGQNLFNPALVARVVLLVSFPVLMTGTAFHAPESGYLFGNSDFATAALDATSGATPLGFVKEQLAKGVAMEEIMANPGLSYTQLLFANMGGSAGEFSAVALILGGYQHKASPDVYSVSVVYVKNGVLTHYHFDILGSKPVISLKYPEFIVIDLLYSLGHFT